MAQIIDLKNWNPRSIRFGNPKENKVGGRSIQVISTQTNRHIHLRTPVMRSFGIDVYTNAETGESDGKHTLSLIVEADAATGRNLVKEKIEEFEDAVLDYVVANSESLFGEQMTKEMCSYTMFKTLKYPKIKNSKKPDLTRDPTMRAKVVNYSRGFEVEVYDTEQRLLFPSEDKDLTPMDFVKSRSSVACVLQCTGIWIGGKGWGLSFKLNQCVVKPFVEDQGVYGRCHITLSDEDARALGAPSAESDSAGSNNNNNNYVRDSDDEEEAPAPAPAAAPKTKVVVKKAVVAESAPAPAPAPAPVTAPEPAPAPVTAPAPAPVTAPAPETEAEAEMEIEVAPEAQAEVEAAEVESEAPAAAAAATTVVKKRIIKKKAPAAGAGI